MAAIEARDGASAASTSASRTSGSTFDLDLLPHDVLLSVVRQLDGGDLARLGVACRTWAKVASDPELWELVTLKHSQWTSVIPYLREKSQMAWKAIFVNLFCLENAMCSHCFKRSRITHASEEPEIGKLLFAMMNSVHLCNKFKKCPPIEGSDARPGPVALVSPTASP